MYSFEISKKLINEFKILAKKSFPKEVIAYLCGTIEQNIITVEELWVPDNVLKYCTKDTILIQPTWSSEAIDYAKDNDLIVVGDIHSHPVSYEYSYAVSNMPSESDVLSRGLAWEQITGICVVRQSKTGRLTSSVKFWGPTVPLDVRIQ